MQVWLETDKAGYFTTAHLPIDDRGLTYGDGLFETIRILNGRPLFFDRHVVRLTAGLATLNLPIPWDAAALLSRCCKLISLNEITNGVLRLTITRGSGPRGFAPPTEPNPTLIIQTFNPPSPVDVSPGEPVEPGRPNIAPPPAPLTLKAILAPWRIDPANPLCHLKHLSALDKVLAKDLAHRQNADDALFLNTHGHLTEATAWNLFIVIEGQVLTPALHCGVLPGITRQLILELAPALGYHIIETELTPHMLTNSSEAFLTNAISGLRPLTHFNHQPIGSGSPGPITAELTQQYNHHCLQSLVSNNQ